MNSRKNVGDVTRQLIQQVTANPARLAANYKEIYPAITDAEAQQLATLFIGLWDDLGDRQELMKRWKPYKTALQAAVRKGRRQPGGGE